MAGAPGGASFEVTMLVIFVCTPIAVPVTFTEKVQVAPAASVAPATLMMFEAGTAVIAALSQVPVRPLSGVDTIRPAGSVSVKASPVSGIGFGLVSVKVRAVLLVPNTWICESANALVIVDGTTTINVANPGLPLPPSIDVTWLVALFFLPPVVALIVTVIKHVLSGGSVPPVRLMLPAVVVTIPPQAGVVPVEVTTSPAGRTSVKPTPVSEKVRFGLRILRVKVVVEPRGTVALPKALLMIGGAGTVV